MNMDENIIEKFKASSKNAEERVEFTISQSIVLRIQGVSVRKDVDEANG